MFGTRGTCEANASLRAWVWIALVAGCADVVRADSGAFDSGPGADRPAEEVPVADVADERDILRLDVADEGDARQQDALDGEEGGRQDAAARSGYTQCRALECDNRSQRCALCPGFEAVCAPLAGVFRCEGEGALIAYCDGDEDCTGSRRCEWRMGDLFASMICVPTNGRACNGFCGAGCGSACQRDEDCARVACGSRCVSPTFGGGVWPGFGRCR